MLTSAAILDLAKIHFVGPSLIPERDWLYPGEPTSAQRAFGDALLRQHPLVAIPSVVSRNSWNLLIAAPMAAGICALRSQEPFVLDPRLHRGTET